MDLLNPEYNISPTAGSRLGSLHDEESKAKMRAAALGRTFNHTEETKIKLRNAILGITRSEETRAKLRIIQSNRKKTPGFAPPFLNPNIFIYCGPVGWGVGCRY
jgi:hypothetical protein